MSNPKNFKLDDLIKIFMNYFGAPRVKVSHHIFKTPWKGDLRINIQKDGKMAKLYQVKLVVKALKKLEVNNENS